MTSKNRVMVILDDSFTQVGDVGDDNSVVPAGEVVSECPARCRRVGCECSGVGVSMLLDLFDDRAVEAFGTGASDVFWFDQGDAVIILGSFIVIWALGEGISASHRRSRFMEECKVELGELKGPTSLSAVQFLVRHKVLKVFVIRVNLKGGSRSV